MEADAHSLSDGKGHTRTAARGRENEAHETQFEVASQPCQALRNPGASISNHGISNGVSSGKVKEGLR
jgi:hypothetical protein